MPDVSFIAGDRLPAEGLQGFVPFAPDLAVEIVSSVDRAEELYGKVREYLAAGTRLVWVFWPKYRAVSVYEPGGVTRELGPDDELDSTALLPSFRVGVTALFDPAG